MHVLAVRQELSLDAQNLWGQEDHRRGPQLPIDHGNVCSVKHHHPFQLEAVPLHHRLDMATPRRRHQVQKYRSVGEVNLH